MLYKVSRGCVKLVLPYPVSSNRYCVRAPMGGLIELRLRLVPRNRICMDLDNCLKVAIDALKGIVYDDDGQVYRITAERAEPDERGARLEVEVLPLVLPMALEAA